MKRRLPNEVQQSKLLKKNMFPEWQLIAAKSESINWTGNLSDDCSAIWAGLLLKAELMDRNVWWWEVTDRERGLVVDTSNGKSKVPADGRTARVEAEFAARIYLGAEL